jgi:hypothetical protein
LFAASLCGVTLAPGCKDDDVGPSSGAPQSGAETRPAGTQAATEAAGGGESRHDLGKHSVAGREVSVTQLGQIDDDGKAAFEIKVGGGGEEPSAVRAWLGIEKDADAVEAIKPAVKQGGAYVVELSRGTATALQPGVKLWVELETADGKESTQFDLER